MPLIDSAARVRVGRLMTMLAIVAASPIVMNAQSALRDVKKSQLARVEQQVADTRIVITYSRPVARGRTLFGGIVPWKEVWTPGADTATAITFTTPVTVNGKALAAGTYSLWTEPDSLNWTVIFNSQSPVFHTRYPRGRDVLRVASAPRTGSHMETLAFYFPVVEDRHAELVLHWGTTIVPLSIEVP